MQKNKYSEKLISCAKIIFFASCTLICLSANLQAQTVLLSPTGDGGFETSTTFALNGWSTVLDANSKWYVGTFAKSAGTRGAYVDVNLTAGTANNYNSGAIRTSHFYRDIAFPAGATNIVLTFKWKANGEDAAGADQYDFIRVFLVSTSTTPVAATLLPSANIIGNGKYNLQSATFQTASITLSNAVAGTTQRLVFTWRNDDSVTNNPGGAIDEVQITYTPFAGSCSPPTGLTASSITSSGATVSWTAAVPAPANGYEYVVSTVNTTPAGSGTATAGTSVPVSGLSSNTTYYLFVRSICGSPNGNSSWAGPFSFTTLCTLITTVPYSEGFNAIGVYPTCWTSTLVVGTNNWVVAGNDGDFIFTPHSGAGMACKNWLSGSNSQALFVSRPINLNSQPSQGVRVNVWIYRNVNGVNADRIRILANTAPNATGATQLIDVRTLITSAPAVPSAGWYNYTGDVPLSFNAASSFYIVFEGTTTSSGSSFSVGFDDFLLENQPPCLPPTGLTATGITSNSATISWTPPASAPANGYEYVVSTVNTTPAGSGTATASTSAAVSLSPNTTYYLFVRSVCGGASGNSPWAGPYSFTTPCISITTVPYIQGFDVIGTTPPSCWTLALITSTENWTFAANDGDFQFTPHTGAAMAVKNWNSAASDALLISPPIDMTAQPAQAVRINVWIYRNSVGANADRVRFFVNNAPNVTGATNLIDVRALYTNAPIVSSPGWYNYIANIPLSFNTGGVFYIIAEGNTGGGLGSYSVGFDDFVLENVPACPTTPVASLNSINATSASISFTCAGCTGTYIVEYGAPGFTPGSGALAGPGGTIVTGASSPIAIGPLTPNSNYTVYVRNNCSAADYSSNSAPLNITTPCLAITTLPYSQSFDVIGVTPACWSAALVTSDENWTFAANDGDIQFTPHSGAGMAVKNWNSEASDALLFSPPFNTSTTPAVVNRINVWIHRSNLGNAADRIRFFVNSIPSTAGATSLLDILTKYTLAPVVASPGWYNYTADIPLSYNSADFYIIAEGNTGGGINSYSVGFDDFMLEKVLCVSGPSSPANGSSACPAAGNVLSWPAFVGASAYNVYFGTTNPATTLVSPNQAGTTYNAGLLAGGSTYYWSIVPQGIGGTTCSTWSFTLNPVPVPSASNSGPVCSGSSLTLFGNNTAIGQTSGNSYSWAGPLGNYTGQNPTIGSLPLSGTGIYSVTVTNSFGCTETASTNVIVNPNPVLSVASVTNASCISATDGCIDIDASNGTPTYVFDYNGSSTLDGIYCGLGSGTFNVTVIDDNGCENNINANVIEEDLIPPAITCPANVTVTTTPNFCEGIASFIAPVGTDNCLGATYTVMDAFNNSSTCSFDVIVADSENPEIACPADVTLNTTPGLCEGTASFIAPVGIDNCSGAVTTQTGGLASGSSFPVGVSPVTYTVTDAFNNTATCSFNITVMDNENPAITCPASITVACGANTAPASAGIANATDNCSATVASSDVSTVSGSCGGTITRTWTATDLSLNQSSCVQTITVSPAALPTMTALAATTVACGAVLTASTLPFSNGLSGGCSISGTSDASTFTATPDACGGTVTETWTATDACGRPLAPVSRTITVSPATLPTMTALAATTVACGAVPVPSTISFSNGLSGGCSISGTSDLSTFTATPDACGGTVTETWTATDACGRPLAPVSRTITVSPATLPTMTALSSTTVACGAVPAPSTISFSNGLSGGCSISGTSDASTFTATPDACGGTVTETWTATDACGRPLAPVSRTITVSPAALPTMTALSATTVACGAVPAPSTISFSNGLSGSCLISGTSDLSTFTATPDACGGTVTETWTATDACGRPLAPVTRTITVSPAALPTMTVPSAITVACGAIPAPSTISFSNGLGGSCSISGTSDASTFTATPDACGGTVTETWTATDACGRPLVPVSRTITVSPATLPTMTALANNTVACGAVLTASTLPFSNGLSGGCSISGTSDLSTFTATPDACGGTVTETWTATDACGRPLAPVSRTITVSPATLPTMTALAATTVACGAVPVPSTISFSNGLSGGCSISGTSDLSTFTATPDACGGTVTETWTATDACGRPLAPVSRTITISPAALPTMTAPANTTVPFSSLPAPGTILYTNGLSGGCLISGNSNISTYSPTPTACVGMVTQTWTATDPCGRPLASVSRIITVLDDVLPTAICHNISVNLSATGTASITAAQINNGSFDNCGTLNLVSVSPSAFTCANTGNNTVTLTVNDGNGNTNTCTATVLVADNIFPTITCPPTVIVNSNPGVCYATNVNLGTPFFGDNCAGATVANDITPSTQYQVGGTFVQWEVTDLSSHKASCNQLVIIQDHENPVALCKNICVSLNSAGTATITSADINNGSHDNCGIASITASKTSFSYADAGANSVTLTVLDINGNSSTCTSTVTVGEYFTLFGSDNNCSASPGGQANCFVNISNGSSVTGNVGSYRLVQTGGAVTINGKVVSGGKVSYGNSVTSGSVSSANLLGVPGNVFTTGSGAHILGDIDVSGNINVNQNAGSTVTGTVRHPAGTTYTGPVAGGGVLTAMPVLPALPGMPAIHSYSCGGVNISGSAILNPGSYGNLVMGNAAGVVVTFHGPGNYYFSNINLSQGGIHTFKYDFMGLPGNINIYVCSAIHLGQIATQWAGPNTPDACRVYFEIQGNGINVIGQGSQFYGRMWSPYSGINVGGGSCCTYVTGSLWSAQKVDLNGAVTVTGCGSPCPPGPRISEEITATDVSMSDMLQVYPNPTSGKTTVRFFTENSYDYTLKVFDNLGRMVISKASKAAAGNNMQEVDMSGWPKGLYMIEIANTDHSQKVKVVVQ